MGSRLLVVIAAVFIAGCGASNSDEPPSDVENRAKIEFQTRVEERIRECMRAQGFDYVPLNPSARQQAAIGNRRIRNGLAPADRRAYDRTLWGDNPGATFQDADSQMLGGCTKKARGAAYGGQHVFDRLVRKLDGLGRRIERDRRMVRARQKWSRCMASKGHRFTNPAQIHEQFLKRFRDLAGPWARTMVTASPEPGATYEREALTALKREEAAIEAAERECDPDEMRPVEAEVRPQYEQAFRRENRTPINRLP